MAMKINLPLAVESVGVSCIHSGAVCSQRCRVLTAVSCDHSGVLTAVPSVHSSAVCSQRCVHSGVFTAVCSQRCRVFPSDVGCRLSATPPAAVDARQPAALPSRPPATHGHVARRRTRRLRREGDDEEEAVGGVEGGGDGVGAGGRPLRQPRLQVQPTLPHPTHLSDVIGIHPHPSCPVSIGLGLL